MPDAVALVLFVLTYVGLALGRIPGLALDRTGFAVLGAVAFLATGRIPLEEAQSAVDVPTLSVLLGMMLLSAQYQVAGLYGAIARRLARVERPRRLLGAVIVVAAALASVLTNDVVCVSLTPLLVAALVRTTLDPKPFLIALACATNIGSAATPIGNPQNILIAQSMRLDFAPFVVACIVPTLAGLALLHLFLARLVPRTTAVPVHGLADVPPVDRSAAVKAVGLTVVALVLFLTPAVPAWLTSLGVAGVVLTSRKLQPRRMLALVDWPLLVMFVALFVVVRGFELSGWTTRAADGIAALGLDLAAPAVLVPVTAILSNLVSNVPAVMLLLPFLAGSPSAGHGLALASTFAGNALLVGSIANLIVVEQAERRGVTISFREHLRIGLPVTLATLALAALWLLGTAR